MKFILEGDGWSEEVEARRGPLRREWFVDLPGDESLDFRVRQIDGPNVLRMTLGDAQHTITLLPGNRPGQPLRFLVDDEYYELDVLDHGDLIERTLGGPKASGGSARVLSVMPGVVTQLLVAAGDTVTEGQSLLILEAMKMENEIRAPRTGVVQQLAVDSGQTVAAGDLLAIIEAKEGEGP